MRNKDIIDNRNKAGAKAKENIEHMEILEERFSAQIRNILIPEFLEEIYGSPPKINLNKIFVQAAHRKKLRGKRNLKIAAVVTAFLTASSLTVTYVSRTPAYADFKARAIYILDLSERKPRSNRPNKFPSYTTHRFLDWEQVERMKKKRFKEMYMPQYIPDGYKFKYLYLLKDEYEYMSIFLYVNESSDMLLIMQYGESSPIVITEVLSPDEVIKVEDNLIM